MCNQKRAIVKYTEKVCQLIKAVEMIHQLPENQNINTSEADHTKYIYKKSKPKNQFLSDGWNTKVLDSSIGTWAYSSSLPDQKSCYQCDFNNMVGFLTISCKVDVDIE